MSTLPYLDAATLHRVLDTPSLVDALARAFAQGAEAPVRHVHAVNPGEGASLLLMPAWRTGEATGIKIVTVYPGNRARGVATVAALYVLLDGATGHPRALLDGEALTLLRTAAASALASRYLSRAEARTLLVVGTGHLAPYMARAHCAVRPIERVLVWGRARDRAQAIAASLDHAQAIDDLPAALAQADIVTCATTSNEPIVKSADVRAGTHIDLVGGFTPTMREADDDLVARASVYVDTFAGALKEAGDLTQPIERGRITREHVKGELADLVKGRATGRANGNEVTLFKSVGTALEDLAAAELAVQRTAA